MANISRYSYIISNKISAFIIKIFTAFNVMFLFILLLDYQTGSDTLSECRGYFILSVITAIILLWLHYKEYHRIYDKIASDSVNANSTKAHKPIVLFLRPFATDGQLPIQQNPLLKSFSDFFILGLNRIGGFEAQLHTMLNSSYRLVRFDCKPNKSSNEAFDNSFIKRQTKSLLSMLSYRIGSHPLPTVGWESVFHDMANKSFANIIVPPCSAETSTCYEIEHIMQSENLNKTIFIMPQSNFKVTISKSKITSNKLWENLGLIFVKRLKLPIYNKLGGLVVNIGGQFELISGVSGSPWYKKKVIKRLLQGGMLTDFAWKDSLRLTVKTALIIPSIFFIILVVFIEFMLSENVGIPINYSPYISSLIVVILLSGAIIVHYRHCHYYLLAKKQILRLSILTFIACIAGFMIGYNVLTYLEHNGWFPAFPPYNENIKFSIDLLVNLLAIFILPSILIFCSAYFVLNKRESVVYYIGGQN